MELFIEIICFFVVNVVLCWCIIYIYMRVNTYLVSVVCTMYLRVLIFESIACSNEFKIENENEKENEQKRRMRSTVKCTICCVNFQLYNFRINSGGS